MEKKSQEGIKVKRNIFSIVLLILLLILILIKLVETVIYPGSEILPPDFFFTLAIVELFLLWYSTVKERDRLLWHQKRREELNEMKTKFTLITSHELMTPVTVIKGYLKLLNDKTLGGLTVSQKGAIDAMQKCSDRLESIWKSLTALSAGRSKSILGPMESASLEPIINDTVTEIKPFIEKRKQSLTVDLQKGMPEVKIDISAVRRVMVNLILNSIRFTPDKGKITIRSREDDRYVSVEVEDNGVGIQKDMLKKIFESFYETADIRKHSSGSVEFKSSGIGVGLTIAKDIIDAHKGKIWAESEPGKFTRVTFTLPKK